MHEGPTTLTTASTMLVSTTSPNVSSLQTMPSSNTIRIHVLMASNVPSLHLRTTHLRNGVSVVDALTHLVTKST
jgi:hypothetical protein